MPQFRGHRRPGLGGVNAFSAVLAGGLRRHDVCRLGSGFLDHNGQTARIVQHRAGAQQILVERLIDAILLEERILIGLQQRIRANVGVGIVHESAGLNIAARVDVDIALAAGNASSDIFTVIPEIHGEQRLGFAEVPNLVVHILALLGGGHQLRHRVLPDGHIGEKPAEFRAPVDHGVDVFLAADELRILARITAGDAEQELVFAQQLHGALGRREGSLAATEVRVLLEALDADRGDEVFNAGDFFAEILIDQRSIGKAGEECFGMALTEGDDVLLADQGLAARVEKNISAKRLGLLNDVIQFLQREIEGVTILRRPAAGAFQVAG